MSYQSLSSKVAQFFAAKNIAVIGVSGQDPNAPANANFDKLKAEGFEVIPVNPRLKQFHDQVCYTDVEQVPSPLEAALIFTPANVTAEVVRQCIDSGVRHIWIHHGAGQGSRSEEASQMMKSHPEINFIDGACPMMFVKNADWFHRGFKAVLKWTKGLPA